MNTLLSRYKQRIEQAAMENARTNFIPMPPDWMKNSSNNSVMGKIDLNDPYGIEQARNAKKMAKGGRPRRNVDELIPMDRHSGMSHGTAREPTLDELQTMNPIKYGEQGLDMPMLADPYNYVGMGLGTGAGNAMRKFVAPKANQMLEDYMVKSGMQLPATVWHGSPHKFDKFDASKLGTGEGSQAYAHGHYTAEGPNVAKGYIPTYEGAPEGQLYKIDLPDEHIAKMLDWDKPISQQHPDVIEGLKKSGLFGKNHDFALDDTLVGQFIKGHSPEYQQWLSSKGGIPGVKYAAQGAGEGTSNYVVFPGNEDMLNILERNGQKLKK
jgi:hypothetical protein